MNVVNQDIEKNRKKLLSSHFYGIVDGGYLQADEMESAASELIRGGAGIIQLRAKTWSKLEIEIMAKKLVGICHQQGCLFIVNDYPDIANSVGASGVHIGQDDGSLSDVRRLVNETMLVGRSTHSVEQAMEAAQEGFDYIGFGPLFPTPTKKGRPGIGVESIRSVVEDLEIPVYCIGGVKKDNIADVVKAGANRVVVVSDVLIAEDREQAVREVLMSLDNLSR